MNLKKPRWSHQPALMMSNSMMKEQQKKAVIKIVRRSLKGLRNEAHKDEAKKIHYPPSLFNQIYWSQGYEAWKWKESSSFVM